MASCGVCGRQVEVSESGQSMPCSCINHPLGKVIWGAIADCVGPAACDRCGTTVGVVAGLCDACTSPRDCVGKPSLEVVDGRLVDFEEDFDA